MRCAACGKVLEEDTAEELEQMRKEYYVNYEFDKEKENHTEAPITCDDCHKKIMEFHNIEMKYQWEI